MTGTAGDGGGADAWYRGTVDADAAWAYALATNDPNEVHLSGEVAPPLFTVALLREAMIAASRRTVPAGTIRNIRAGVHGTHEVRLHAPVRPGMRLRWRSSPYNVHRTKAGIGSTVLIEVQDEDGTPLVDHLWGNLWVGGEADDDVLYGPAPTEHAFPEDARGRPLGSYTFQVPRDQGFRYAGVSFDFNPHIVSDEGAHRDGFPSKIIQGLCSFAMCSGALVKVNAGGDQARLRGMVARFASPVFPGHAMEVRTYDAGLGVDGSERVAFEAVSQGRTVIQHGLARLTPQ